MAKTAKKPKPLSKRDDVPSIGKDVLAMMTMNHTGESDVIIIGHQTFQDEITLSKTFHWLKQHRNQPEYIDERYFKKNDFDSYNMGTHPERGDAIDAINEKTRLVIALYLNGLEHPAATSEDNEGTKEMVRQIDARDGKPKGYRYNRANITLPGRCLAVGASLVAWGEQPVHIPDGMTATKVNDPDEDGQGGPVGYIYEPAPVEHVIMDGLHRSRTIWK